MEPPSRWSSMKMPLITPSASPPPLRTQIHSHRRGMSESAPPLKRQRTTQTPIRETPGLSASSSSLDPIDVQQERKASTTRLLDFWDSLARYTRPLDEDDLVDVLTGEITRDNGVLRNSQSIHFGKLNDPTATDYPTSDEGSDKEDTEYDRDELDAFLDDPVDTYDSDGGLILELDAGREIMPPVTPLDPADANDLAEFMEAERRRRETCGTDIEHEDEDDAEEQSEVDDEFSHDSHSDVDHPRRPATSAVHEEEHEEEEEEEENEEDQVEATKSSEVHPTYDTYSDHLVPLESASEDELDNWDTLDDGVVHTISRPEVEDTDSEVEIVEERRVLTSKLTSTEKKTRKSFRDTSTKPPEKPKHVLKAPRQLYTPPESQSSSVTARTPVHDDFTELPSNSTRLSSSPVSHSSLTNSPKKNKSFPVKGSPKSKFTSERVDVPDRLDRPTPTRRLDLSSSRGGPRSTNNTPNTPKKPSLSNSEFAKQPSKPKPFVLLTPRKSASPQKLLPFLSDGGSSNHTSPNKSSKGKGKVTPEHGSPKHRNPTLNEKRQRQTLQTTSKLLPPADKRDHLLPKFSSSPRARTPKNKESVPSSSDVEVSPQCSSLRHALDQVQPLSPTFPSPPVPRKRKRILSDMEMEALQSYGSAFDHEIEEQAHEPSVNARHASTSSLPNDVSKPKGKGSKRSSSRRRRRSPETQSDAESSVSSTSSRSPQHHSRSRSRIPQTPSQHPYSHPHTSYMPSHHPPAVYAPIPDQRAQIIIAQAMQQLSVLAQGGPWIPPHQYHESSIPQTPSHRHQNMWPSTSTFITPTHHRHPYPYSYDPNLSYATLPPDSPDEPSPEKSSSPRKKSIVRRSRSRGRRVSFHFEDEDRSYHAENIHSSPSSRRHSRGTYSNTEHVEWSTQDARLGTSKGNGKGKAREQTPHANSNVSDHETDSESSDNQQGRPTYSRGQTPGPSLQREKPRPASSSRSGKQKSQYHYREG